MSSTRSFAILEGSDPGEQGPRRRKPKKGQKAESASEDEPTGDEATSSGGRPVGSEPTSARKRTSRTRRGRQGQVKLKAEAGRLVVSIILKSFIDARLFGSSLAFKDWDIEPRPKTLTGAVQINMGEVLHEAHEVDIAGTSTFASKEENRAGTFTTFYGLRYGLIGFNGIANEHSAKLSQLTDADYERFLEALWRSVSSAPTANTRSKMGQVPRLLVDITYRPGSEFQFGCLLNYAKVVSKGQARVRDRVARTTISWTSVAGGAPGASERRDGPLRHPPRHRATGRPSCRCLEALGPVRVTEGREGGLTMRVVRFRYQGRVGHFLRAEMNASALSYPVPPRTALLGLVGNILGLGQG